MSGKLTPAVILGSLVFFVSCQKDDVEKVNDDDNTGTRIHKLIELSSFIDPATGALHDTSAIFEFTFDDQSRIASLHRELRKVHESIVYDFEYNPGDHKAWKMTETFTRATVPASETRTHFLVYNGEFVQQDSVVSSLGTYYVQEAVPSGDSFHLNLRGNMFPPYGTRSETLVFSDGKLERYTVQPGNRIYTATYTTSQNPLAGLLPDFAGWLEVISGYNTLDLKDKLVQRETFSILGPTYDTRIHEYIFREDGYPVQRVTRGHDDFRKLIYTYQ